MEKPTEILRKLSGRKIAIVTHNKADADAISSAFALSKFFQGSQICTSEEMTEGARLLSERLGIGTRELDGLDKKDFDGIIVVDTSAYTLVPSARGWKILCIVDHHRSEGKDMKGEYEIIDENSPSAAEIVAGALPDMDRDVAFALAVGVIADGARFKSARAETFATLHKLMKISGAGYQDLLTYAEPEPRQEAKIAVLSGMRKVQYEYAAGYIIATTEVSSNESDAASIITEAADVAFVAKWKEREKETRISARARKSVKVPLNAVMAEVGKSAGGAGGGHPKAAGGALKLHTEEALRRCVETFIKTAGSEAK